MEVGLAGSEQDQRADLSSELQEPQFQSIVSIKQDGSSINQIGHSQTIEKNQ